MFIICFDMYRTHGQLFTVKNFQKNLFRFWHQYPDLVKFWWLVQNSEPLQFFYILQTMFIICFNTYKTHRQLFTVKNFQKICSGFDCQALSTVAILDFKSQILIESVISMCHIYQMTLIDSYISGAIPMYVFVCHYKCCFWDNAVSNFRNKLIWKWYFNIFLQFVLSALNLSNLPIQNTHLKFIITFEPLVLFAPFKHQYVSINDIFKMMYVLNMQIWLQIFVVIPINMPVKF
jgi:hypothetical protein